MITESHRLNKWLLSGALLFLLLGGCAPSALIHEIGGEELFVKRVRTRDGFIPISFFDKKVEMLTTGGKTTIALNKFANIEFEPDSLKFYEGTSWVKTTLSMAEIEKGSDRLIGYIKTAEKLHGYLNGGRYTVSIGQILSIGFTRDEDKSKAAEESGSTGESDKTDTN